MLADLKREHVDALRATVADERSAGEAWGPLAELLDLIEGQHRHEWVKIPVGARAERAGCLICDARQWGSPEYAARERGGIVAPSVVSAGVK